MDTTPVTNAQFAAFVAATGYRSFAQVAPDPADYPGMDPALAVPGSAVFTMTDRPVPLDDPSQWWRWTPGADWAHPLGAESTIADIMDHPVVHIAMRMPPPTPHGRARVCPPRQSMNLPRVAVLRARTMPGAMN
jgi:formylglycine-generating enzyme required for sulfatase activity